jgi:hypothetical protein
MFGAEASFSTTSSDSSGSSRESGSIRRLGAQDEEFVRNLMRQFSAGTTADTGTARKQAIRDVQGNINQLFTQFRETALPQIMTRQNRTGGYNSTTAQLLSNDAYARTVAQGSAMTMDAINNYEQTALAKSQQALSGFSSSLQALLQAQQTSDSSASSQTKTKSSTTSVGASYGFT